MKNRSLIIHYHIYKNAGTSLDESLKLNFKDNFVEIEGNNGDYLNSTAIEEYIRRHKNIKAISSHTLSLPIPKIDNINIYPIFFVRHPVDRVRSIYDFERNQLIETEGSIMAKKLSFKAFVEWRLSRLDDFSIRNFQSYRFCQDQVDNGKALDENLLNDVIKKIILIGSVNHYAESMRRLENWLKEDFPEINLPVFRLNASRDLTVTLENKIEATKSELGLYNEVIKRYL
jgi:hypothetical protein